MQEGDLEEIESDPEDGWGSRLRAQDLAQRPLKAAFLHTYVYTYFFVYMYKMYLYMYVYNVYV